MYQQNRAVEQNETRDRQKKNHTKNHVLLVNPFKYYFCEKVSKNPFVFNCIFIFRSFFLHHCRCRGGCRRCHLVRLSHSPMSMLHEQRIQNNVFLCSYVFFVHSWSYVECSMLKCAMRVKLFQSLGSLAGSFLLTFWIVLLFG